MAEHIEIAYRCPFCNRSNYAPSDAKVDGPDGEVVVFVADADEQCRDCGKSLREMFEAPDA